MGKMTQRDFECALKKVCTFIEMVLFSDSEEIILVSIKDGQRHTLKVKRYPDDVYNLMQVEGQADDWFESL